MMVGLDQQSDDITQKPTKMTTPVSKFSKTLQFESCSLTFVEAVEVQFIAPDAAQVARVGHKLMLHGLMVGTQNTPSSKYAEHSLSLLGEGHHSTLPFLHRSLTWVGWHPLSPTETGHIQLMD